MIILTKTKLSLALLVSVIGFAGQMHGMQQHTNEGFFISRQSGSKILYVLDKERKTTGYNVSDTGIDLEENLMIGVSLLSVEPYCSYAPDAVDRLLKTFAAVDEAEDSMIVGFHVHSLWGVRKITKITRIIVGEMKADYSPMDHGYVVKVWSVPLLEASQEQSINRGLESLARKSLDGMKTLTDSE